MRLLLVDDHPLVAAGLRDALAHLNAEVILAHSLAEARERLLDETFDSWILDINMPDGIGTKLLREPDLSDRLPQKCLLLSAATDPDDIAMALDEGATAFVSKSINSQDLIKAIEQFLRLPIPLPEAQVWDQARATFVPAREVFPRGTVLSPREREVFTLMREGLHDKVIAYRLGRSIHTVRVQIRAIRRKRGKTRRAEVG